MKKIAHTLGQLLGKPRSQPAPQLGERELEVMKICWQSNTLSAKEILEQLSSDSLSLSSLQSTLERLHRKNLLLREKQGRFYVYSAAVSRREIITQLLGDITEQISDGDIAPMISGFMDFIDQTDAKPLNTNLKKSIERLPSNDDE
ncbi:BlaI/MecI/CopY family transcriptional regulator [Sessilibacter corallicola]|uniref:Transcriptional regulator n=1 Tax=Sessilibacter corallicola TaxID=2904075 RepID=A0ABQ0ACR2_9GAMM|nr:BlaI/MecI/CopY family transcriptional regulator [Sessilibacter corallicola]MCE2030136.1 BlaI/MecI/CopY family transcriptional regulator [Sessilibacter corallicola]